MAGASDDASRERALWLRGQGEALTAAVNDAPLTTSLGALVRTATTALGEGARAAFYLASDDGTALHHIVGTSEESARAVGYRGCWSFPIHSAAGGHVGSLTIYGPQPRHATARELELASLLTNAASIIISRHREALTRRQAEAALRASEEQYRSLFNSIDEGFCTIEVLFDAAGRACDYRFLETNPAFVRHTGIVGGVGQTMRDLAREHEDFWFETYGRIATTGEPMRFEHGAAALGRFYDVYAFRIGEPGDNRVAVIFKDISERKRAEEALRESEERQTFLLTLSDALRAEEHEDAIATTALNLLADWFRVERCSVASVDAAGDRANVTHEVRRGDGRSLLGAHPLSGLPDPMRRVFEQPVVIDDVSTDPTLTEVDRHSLLAMGFRGAYLAVPLLRGERNPVWAITSASTAPRRWTPCDVSLVEEVVERTRAAIERAQSAAALLRARAQLESRVEERTSALAAANAALEAEVRERRAGEAQIKALFARLVAAQEEERQRIARDIHDQLGQQMTALRMNLELLASRVEQSDAAAPQAARTQRLAEELDRSVDFLTWDLRPAALDHLGLAAALEKLVTGWSERFAIAAEFDASRAGSIRLSRDKEANLYRLAQEALHNVVKHAQATQVSASLQRRGSDLLLVLEDNGCGFAMGSAQSRGGGLGLVSMQERAALIGGAIDIESEPGRGTTIFVSVPIASGGEEDA